MTLSKRDFLKWISATTVLAGCSSEGQNTSEERPQPEGVTDPITFQPGWTVQGIDVPSMVSFDNTMKSFMQARSIKSGALAVTRNGRLALARGYSNYDDGEEQNALPTSLFRIASISKPITATAVMRLVQDNQLNLSDRLVDILSLIPISGETTDNRIDNITIRHLLQHLGGWDRSSDIDPMFQDSLISDVLGVSLPISKENIVTFMAGRSLQHTPGTQFAYSNFGYSLLGKIIEQSSGLSYEDYVKRVIFEPLNISGPRLGRSLPQFRATNEVKYHSSNSASSVFDNSRPSVPYPYGGWNLENMDAHGGWLASAVDLVRFASTFDDPLNSPVLDASSIEAMLALPENISPANYSLGDAYYGCGWQVRDWGNGLRNTWHTGSLSGTSTLLVRRRDGLNWCVLFNQREDSSGLSYSEIDGMLHSAADSVSNWPDHDMFDTYL